MNNKGQREELPGGWVHESIVAPLLRTLAYSGLSEQPFRGKVNADSVFI